MSETKICPMCNQPYEDYGGTLEINGHEVCQRCGNRILGMPEDTQWFEPAETSEEPEDEEGYEDEEETSVSNDVQSPSNEDEGAGQDSGDEEDDDDEEFYDDEDELTEEDHEPIVSAIMEREREDTSENGVLLVREEPEKPHHIVVVPTIEEPESPAEPQNESAETSEEPHDEDADSDAGQDSGDEETVDEPESKKKRFAIGKLERRKEPKKKKEKKKEEREYDPDSFHERFRRWKLIHNEGYVILKTLSRDAKEEYHLETTLVKMEDLPKEAVQVTNQKHTYCLDLVKTSKWYLETHVDPYEDYYESQFTASDAALYMMSNKIDNALAIKWTELSHVDYKKYIIIAGVGLCVLLFLIVRMSG